MGVVMADIMFNEKEGKKRRYPVYKVFVDGYFLGVFDANYSAQRKEYQRLEPLYGIRFEKIKN